MTDVPEPARPEPASREEQPAPERVRTGVAGVDEVITAVEELEDRPIEEHAGVFETAHEQLRRALDAADQPVDEHTGSSADA